MSCVFVNGGILYNPGAVNTPPTVLNVGGGSKAIALPARYAGWKHVLLDIDSRFGADLVMDARQLIHEPADTYDAVYCSHNLEHYHRHEAEQVIRGMLHVLKLDGFAEIRVPDLLMVMKHVVANGMDIDDVLYRVADKVPILVRDVLYGYHREIEKSGNDFFGHKTGFSAATLAQTIRQCGFETVAMTEENEFEAIAFAFKKAPSRQRLDGVVLGMKSGLS